MVEIKEGPELNRAVAEAGLIYQDNGQIAKMADWCTEEGGHGHRVLRKFSTDLNAAFAAAEKVGLFTPSAPWRTLFAAVVYGGKRLVWYVGNHEHWLETGEPESSLTPALAICAAILKLKETE